LQEIITRKKTNYCIKKQKGLEVREQLDDLRKENKDLFDKLYVQKYVGDMMQRLVMQSQHESDLAAQKREYELKLTAENMACQKLSMTLAIHEAANKEIKSKLIVSKHSLPFLASSFDDKIVVEVARAIFAFNDKLATEHFDVAADFDA
jgi:hypothetical protein